MRGKDHPEHPLRVVRRVILQCDISVFHTLSDREKGGDGEGDKRVQISEVREGRPIKYYERKREKKERKKREYIPTSSSRLPTLPIGVLLFIFSMNSSVSSSSRLISVLKYHGLRAFTVMLKRAHSLASCLVSCTTALRVLERSEKRGEVNREK